MRRNGKKNNMKTRRLRWWHYDTESCTHETDTERFRPYFLPLTFDFIFISNAVSQLSNVRYRFPKPYPYCMDENLSVFVRWIHPRGQTTLVLFLSGGTNCGKLAKDMVVGTSSYSSSRFSIRRNNNSVLTVGCYMLWIDGYPNSKFGKSSFFWTNQSFRTTPFLWSGILYLSYFEISCTVTSRHIESKMCSLS